MTADEYGPVEAALLGRLREHGAVVAIAHHAHVTSWGQRRKARVIVRGSAGGYDDSFYAWTLETALRKACATLRVDVADVR